MKQVVRVGSRESKLAVVQSRLIMDQIKENHPEIELELVTMKTTGDIILDKTLDKVGGKGLFVKELDKALREKRIDISVHSLKDMPAEVPEDLPLIAFSHREAAEDVLVMPIGVSIEEMDRSKPIGSSSPRRNAHLSRLYPDMEQKSVRGNVLTRLEKLDRGEYSCLVLAKAGLVRLGLAHRISKTFTAAEMVPAAGQGIMVVQGRLGEDYEYLKYVNDTEAEMCAIAERALVAELEGGCSSPIGAFASLCGNRLKLRAFYSTEDQRHQFTKEIEGDVYTDLAKAISLAKELAESMRTIISSLA